MYKRQDQIQAIETQDVAVLLTSQIAVISSQQTMVMTTTQVEALTSDQIPAFTTTAYQYLTTGTPIILDLDGNGVSTQSIDAGVRFDLFADGSPVRTGWVSPTDGLLVLDRNHDGRINDGSELFGSSTVLANGQKASDGYTALRELDGNHDGVISSTDAAYGDLRIWIDSNSDGVSDESELRTLTSLGIAKIRLTATTGTTTDNGNILGLTSSYETTDGVTHDAADVWFLADRTPTTSTTSAAANQASARSLGSVDSAIAALNPSVAPLPAPTLAVPSVVSVPATAVPLPPALVVQPGDAAQPLVLGNTSALRAQVSNMAQALGAFVDGGPGPAGSVVSGQDGQTKLASPVAIAASNLAEALKQFDVQGQLLNGSPTLGVATQSTPQFHAGSPPSSSGVLAGTEPK